MEKLYQDYKNLAEFFMVYISEAHAVDDRHPVAYAKDLGIKEHTSFGERCSVASRLRLDKELTIPCLVDNMDNAVEQAYSAWPDRIFLVRKDGVLGVAAKRGPWGFKPALNKVGTWLASYKETGKEPPIPEPGDEEPNFYDLSFDLNSAYLATEYKKAVAIAEEMHKLRPDDVGTMYNLACMYCLVGSKDKAYTTLEKAVDGGYEDADHLLADDDFKTIREEERFGKLVQRARENSSKRGADRRGPSGSPEAVVGKWEMETKFGGGSIDATMTLSVKDGKLAGTWESQGGVMNLVDLKYADGTLSFKRTIPGGPALTFTGTVEGDKIKGMYTGDYGELECTGGRNSGR